MENDVTVEWCKGCSSRVVILCPIFFVHQHLEKLLKHRKPKNQKTKKRKNQT